MTRIELADKLRDYFSQKKRVSRVKMDNFTDAEMINIYNTCPCCERDMLDDNELEEVLKISDDLDEFFEMFDIYLDARDAGSHIDGEDTEESYDRALLT